MLIAKWLDCPGTAMFKSLSPQPRNVYTTWSSWSIAVHVLTAAPPLRPARPVTETTGMAAPALTVDYTLYTTVYTCFVHSQLISIIPGADVKHERNDYYLPSGTVFDDISKTGCIAQDQCPCQHKNKLYKSGESYSDNCRSW